VRDGNINPNRNFPEWSQQRLPRITTTNVPGDDTEMNANRPSNRSIAMSHQIHTYTELLQQIHDDLRIQHPEWVEPNGESQMCDAYEARLIELLTL